MQKEQLTVTLNIHIANVGDNFISASFSFLLKIQRLQNPLASRRTASGSPFNYRHIQTSIQTKERNLFLDMTMRQ